jgi:cytidylate kinase
MIITIDGPSGSGKTKIAEIVAEKLNLPHFDTGAMYRSVAYMFLQEKNILPDENSVEKILKNFHFKIISLPKKRYIVNGLDITEEIRSEAVTNIVSSISAHESIRKAIWKIQRQFAKKQGGVFDGRDMGSFVFPTAQIKIFLTATPQERGKRRLTELCEKRPNEAKHFNHQQMTETLLKRDLADSSRAFAPLQIPSDAYVIDSSHLSIEEVVQKILEYKKQKTLQSVTHPPKKTKILYKTVLSIAWCIGKLFYRIKSYGKQHCYSEAAIIAANHSSFLDPIIIAISWPEEVHFLARESLFKNRFFGGFIRKLNTHPISSTVKDTKSIKTICNLLTCGKKVVIFPEGKRSANNQLQPLQPGVASLSLKNKAAIIPVYIDGTYKIWNRKHKLPKCFGKISCVFGSPIRWESFIHLEKKEAQAEITKTLTQAITNLKKWFEEGAQGIPP